MLRAKGIKKSYNDLDVLKGVDLDIYDNELVSIIGKSGSGKSTLLHILGSLDEYDSGSIFIDDTRLEGLSPKQLAKFRNEKIGFVFQFHHLLSEFTALENAAIPAYIAGRSKEDANAKASELLDFLGLKDRKDHKPSQLSGGEQQRVAIARALINTPKLILADEPTGNLDSQTSAEMLDLFVELKESFKTSFIIVTHDMALAKRSDRCFTMTDGLIAETRLN